MNWNSVVIIVCILIAAFAIYREYLRANKAHLVWRVVAALVAIVALACIALPLTYNADPQKTTANGKILLTEGFDPDSLNRIDSLYTLDKSIHQQYPKAKLLYNIDQLFTDSMHIAPINVYGYGLNEDELKQLSGRPINFHNSPIPDGFTAVGWTEKLKAGQQFTVQGHYKNTSVKPYQLVLKGLNTTLDSVTIPAKAEPAFTLATTPKSTGRVIYQLIVLNGKDTISHEQVPVIIDKTEPLKVLTLSSSPDFESKFLRNWLGANGYGVSSRALITKGKFGQEYLNMDKPDLTHINTALLNKFDVVIGELSELKNLSPAESAALQQEVTQKGLGLIVRADSSDKKASWVQSGFPVTYMAGKQAALSPLFVQGKGKTGKLNIDPVYINQQSNTQSLVTDQAGHLLAGVTLNGAGKIVFTTVNNTYSWMLSGNKNDYTAIWSLLIDKAARRLPAMENWSVITSPSSPGQAAELIVEGGVPSGGIALNKTTVYPAQNPAIPFQRSITYWPSAYGWQQASQQNGKLYWWYVWKNKDWQSLKAAKKIALTSRYVKANLAGTAVTKQIHQKTRAAVPKMYFYILFLIAATFLWAESKFVN
ncbi:hypothetical protein [Mucilaginibacter boryungensis]|uniref:Membrane protein (TIGR02226 family) n=1 Tax=Mucilaginibacter boryungensis TaxID=768480 RepID=A0ABR9XIH7_9SPHI|nr:hypothetical protein [Mucilaginibacter boryungensis]MBE9667066.1 hypothetical protein [Mucilaginibacter boryungensis]